MRLPDGRIRKRRRSSNDADSAHALTFTTWRRQPFLASDRAGRWLAESIEHARARHHLDLWAFVMMPDHVHLIIWPRAELNLAKLLASVKLPVARRVIAHVRQAAPQRLAVFEDKQPNGACAHRFWQRGGGYDRDLRDAGTIHATIDYIHANPVRRGLVAHPNDYQWSSAAFFTGVREGPLRPDVASIPSPPTHWRFWSVWS